MLKNCGCVEYTVQQNDSIKKISESYNIKEEDIINLNPDVNLQTLNVGDKICIPNFCNGRESLAYLYGGGTDFYLDLISKIKNSITTICTDSFEVSGDGNLLTADSYKLNNIFVDVIHGKNILITPFLTNNWSRELGILALNNRESLSSQIANAVLNYNLDGVNIDIENVTEVYRAQYVDFIRLIREKLPANKVISVAVAANPNGWTKGWHGSYDYKLLSEYSDYLVIMAYDESYQGGEEGPVSSKSFFENSIKYALNQAVPKQKIIVGIPFFGRYWKVGDSFGGIGIADVDIENLLKNYESFSRFYENTESAFAEVTIKESDEKPEIWGYRELSEGTYRIWYDNIASTVFKLRTIDIYDLRGVGCWALGQENLEIWNFYISTLNKNYSMKEEIDMTREEILNLVYPIGSIYMSVNNINPSGIFGGEWVRFGRGRTIFSVDENDEQGNFNVAQKEGGKKEHRHNFRVAMHWWYGAACGEGAGNGTGAYRYSNNQYDGWARNLESKRMIVNNANFNNPSSTITEPAGKWSLGDTDTANNFPPYITCYFWSRVA